MARGDVRDYMGLNYAMILRQDDEGDWIASIMELEGCMADGETPEAAIQSLQSMKELWLRARLDSGRPVPLPEADEEEFSGKWLQRVPKSLHRKVARAAGRDGVSLNQFVAATLAEAVGVRSVAATEPVSVFTIGDLDLWPSVPKIDIGEWQPHWHGSLDRKCRDVGIRSLLKHLPETAVNPIGKGLKSGIEETDEIWGEGEVAFAGR